MNLKGSQSKLLISINDKLYSMFLVKKNNNLCHRLTGFWSRKVYLLTSSTHSGLPALLSATYLSEPCETCTLHCATAPLRHPRWNPELKDWGFFLAWTCKQRIIHQIIVTLYFYLSLGKSERTVSLSKVYLTHWILDRGRNEHNF